MAPPIWPALIVPGQSPLARPGNGRSPARRFVLQSESNDQPSSRTASLQPTVGVGRLFRRIDLRHAKRDFARLDLLAQPIELLPLLRIGAHERCREVDIPLRDALKAADGGEGATVAISGDDKLIEHPSVRDPIDALREALPNPRGDIIAPSNDDVGAKRLNELLPRRPSAARILLKILIVCIFVSPSAAGGRSTDTGRSGASARDAVWPLRISISAPGGTRTLSTMLAGAEPDEGNRSTTCWVDACPPEKPSSATAIWLNPMCGVVCDATPPVRSWRRRWRGRASHTRRRT
jgi:hypothetical protein